MVKYLTWLILVVVLFISILSDSISLSNGEVTIAAMLLLLSIFPDLQDFNFWGLRGRKGEEKLKNLEGETALTDQQVQISPKKLDEAEKAAAPIQLMDTAQGNFLALAFEVERLLRMFATVGLAKDIPANTSITKLTKDLRGADLLTEIGVKQIEAIHWVRNILVHGRQSEINKATLDTGIEIAHSLYVELYKQLYGEEPNIA
ncbi:MAG TPA: hypothetical protein VLF69_05545 [Candidatus Saccharimonadales bacterium]|nr:hypothetical protein [Candidatus Saccharimonadales bacterium]